MEGGAIETDRRRAEEVAAEVLARCRDRLRAVGITPPSRRPAEPLDRYVARVVAFTERWEDCRSRSK